MRSNYLACLLLLAAAGCEKNDPLFCTENPGATGCPRVDGDVVADDATDGMDGNPGIDARLEFGTGAFAVTLTQGPQNPVIFSGGVFDTTENVSSNPICLATQPANWKTNNNPDACFIVGSSIQINGVLNVQGNRPLVLLSATTITVNADLDVASHRGGKTGPGAPATQCGAFAATPANGNTGAGGGAGGSFMELGGTGGDGNGGAGANGAPAPKETANPLILRAGCSGQAGGTGNGGAQALGGAGGGAIYLLAGQSITIATGVTINASGAGSSRALGKNAGGGGGGSGGMILLNAPTITATGAFLMANGGGGSSGANNSGGGNSDDGEDPIAGQPTTPATGGTAPTNAGAGGNGWVLGDVQAPQGTLGSTDSGGGGGGGAAGWIQATIDPAATSSPATNVL